MDAADDSDRLACRNCTRLKVKCDKQDPCSRCTRTGHECLAREMPARRRRHAMPSQVGTVHARERPRDAALAFPAAPTPPLTGVDGLLASTRALLQDSTLGKLLVKFHVKHLAWHHNVLHSPTFLDECETFWSGHDTKQPLWFALYLAVLSTSAWTIENAAALGESLRLQHGVITGMAARYYQGMVDVLYSSDFTANHSMHSLQAVLVSTMVAHCLGKTEQLYTMMFCCIRIAQCLGLHRIRHAETIANQTLEQWCKAVDNELGRRIYWKLVECDFYAIPYTSTYGINFNHITSSMPSNCDDHDLEDQDLSVLTISTFTNVMIRMSLLMPQLLDLLQSAADSPVSEQFEHVIEIDGRMRKFVSTIPQVLLRQGSEEEFQPVWLDTARRTVALAAADKIIMIHRSFLMKSFETPLLLFTRTTCVSAAITILKELETMDDREHIPIWTHAAYAINAAIILCMQIQHSPRYDEKCERYRDMVMRAQARLRRMKSDDMSIRGSKIIQSMLTREQDSRLNRGVQGNSISHSFAGGPETQSSAHHTIGGLLALDDVLATSQGMVSSHIDTQLGSFEDWFAQAFGVLRPS